jgi:hypothetical protein
LSFNRDADFSSRRQRGLGHNTPDVCNTAKSELTRLYEFFLLFQRTVKSFEKCLFSPIVKLCHSPIDDSNDPAFVRCKFTCERRYRTNMETLLNMQLDCIEINDLDQLRSFVSCTLCQKNDFEEGVFRITEKLLTKCGKMCGLFFCLHGPRSVKLTAVWESEKNAIFFYGSTGERFQKIILSNSQRLAGCS